MRFRKRSSGFRGRRPREPVDWDHTTSIIGNSTPAGGIPVLSPAVATVTVWSPATDYFTGKEDRLTLRRLIIRLASSINFGAGGVGDVYQVGWGLLKLQTSAGAPNPLLITASDKQEDWLLLGSTQIIISVAAAVVVAPAQQPFTTHFDNTWDVRVARRLELSELIQMVWSVQPVNIAGATRTVTLNLNSVNSALYQRSMRR